jgi:O-antigen/teichoic acid export membrane protein
MTKEDPGWRPSKWYLLIPLVGELMKGRAWRKETNLLVNLRSTFLRILISLFMFLWAFSFIAPWDGGDEQWVPWAVAAFGIYTLAAMAWVRRRPPVTESPEELAGSYQATFFMGVGLAQSPAMVGLAGVFIGDSLWIYLVGLAFSLVALWTIAPTRQDIERRQREITAAGSPLSLLNALISAPPPKP